MSRKLIAIRFSFGQRLRVLCGQRVFVDVTVVDDRIKTASYLGLDVDSLQGWISDTELQQKAML